MRNLQYISFYFAKIFLSCLLVNLFLFNAGCRGLSPSIKGMTDLRREFTEGEDMLLTCIVSNLGAHTVIWSKIVNGRKKIVAIDKLAVVQDNRTEILHDKAPSVFNSTLQATGGDVWVLSIKNVTVKDSGGYICRINSFPPAQSYYMVSVRTLEATALQSNLRSTHNYTSCCEKSGVKAKCLGFCNLHDILEGRTGIEPEECEEQFPNIVQCMADYRDHTQCCERQGIPDICQDLCRGEYTVQDDFVKSHFSCTGFTEATLLCISEGIDILPHAPRAPSVEILGPHTLLVEWTSPAENSPAFEHFVINVTMINRFDPAVDVTQESPDYKQDLDRNDDVQFIIPKKMQIKVPANVTKFKIENLTPMTWYEISVTSLNKFGSSLSPYSIRSLTDSVRPDAKKHVIVTPELPDIVGCCISKGIKHERCLQNLCNPSQRYIEEPDMIVCAAWAKESFSCLTGDMDHSDCCRSRGLPDICVELCSGNITSIDYNYFKCVDYFSDYRSCLLKGYGVLPGPPRNVLVDNIHQTFALLNWDPPIKNNESVKLYHTYFRPINLSRECYRKSFEGDIGVRYIGSHTKSSPQVLENLCENTKYEVYIKAVNAHGSSDPSSRILFQTPKFEAEKQAANIYNASKCCSTINVSPGCLPLCKYNVRMSHFRILSETCTPEMSKVFRCIVGGRDHTECCKRRGVPFSCRGLCSGSIDSDDKTPAGCLSYIGNIFMCLEEGVNILPGPVNSLHATEILDTGVTLQWNPPSDSPNVTSYQIHYQEVDKYSARHAVFRLNHTMNVTQPVAVLADLKNGSLYNIFVISVNEFGTSLPSSILTITTVKIKGNSSTVAGVPSAPHSLLLEEKTATSLTILWQPPYVSLPTDRLRYTLHFATLSLKNNTPFYNKTITSSTAMRLDGLSPNTQYILFVSANNDMGESRPSETLLAWTDPSYPAFVETPTVHPTNQVIEGGSMTILCIAMGSPNPNVSLYISGVLYRQDVTRHMVTVVNNVTRAMTEISCYADNGYGTPMQSSVSITVSHRPLITAEESVKVVEGSEVTLECLVSAWPDPTLVWWKDVDKRIPVIHGGNTSIKNDKVSKGHYRMQLTVKNSHRSSYYCHASNALGSFSHTVKIETWDRISQPLNVTECCHDNGVKASCINACDFEQINFHKVMNKEECIPDFEKLLTCGADMSDHRGCCSKKGVSSHCLDWCRAKALSRTTLYPNCLLKWAPSIFACFLEGQDTLPGPPQNIRFESTTPTAAKISWDIPIKNPLMVERYRVFWRRKGTKNALKNDTSSTSLYIYDLIEQEIYEVAVKAGNHLGTSVLTDTLLFKHEVSYVSSRSTEGSTRSGIAIGLCLGITLLIGLLIFAWWAYRRRQIIMKSINGISFENPSYIREQNGDVVQIAETPNGSLNGGISTNMNIPLTNSDSNASSDLPNGTTVWNTQSVNNSNVPGFENDLDSKGGYKRFKS